MSTLLYDAVIGLEVHCQLSTKSKIFCACPAHPPQGVSVSDVLENTFICEVCTGQPGALPVLNETAVRFAIRAGLAVGSTVNQSSTFERKNYFYPDLPKGYQISQYSSAICEGGRLEVENSGILKNIRIRRIHLEEDAGKSVHQFGSTLVNLNRAGVPLIEIVGEPDLASPEEAGAYLRELHALVTALKITDGNMQEGNFRCDANVSVRPKGVSTFGTRVEIKNVNSFRFVEKAIAFEIQRQVAILSSGKKVIQETRLYDPQKDQTFTMRVKEVAEDYRYFPDPDLPDLVVPAGWIEQEKKNLPELPRQKRERYQRDFGLASQDSKLLTSTEGFADFFEQALAHSKTPETSAKAIVNLLSGEISRLIHESEVSIQESLLTPQHLAKVADLIAADVLSSTGAKKVIHLIWCTGEAVGDLVEREGLTQQSNAELLEPIIAQVLSEYPQAVEELSVGKMKVMGFLVGTIMKRTGGRANPALIQDLIRRRVNISS